MESIIKDSITTFLEQNQITSHSQHGFTKGRSCLTNLLESLEQWTQALDNGYGVDILYLDYRKAFDNVPHQRLIHKLSTLGCQGKLLLRVESFLHNRTMRVGVRGSYSSWFDMLSGVPQGSVLGPILFLLYVNEIPSWILSSINMFADDTKVWRVIETDPDCTALKMDINVLLKWSDQWLLHFKRLDPEDFLIIYKGYIR